MESFLSELTQLKELNLGENFFIEKIPSELGALEKLEIMYLHMNYLERTIPSSLSNCTALHEFSMFQNFQS